MTMNRALLPETLQCTDVAVLQRQQARIKWQQEQFQQVPDSYFGELSGVVSVPNSSQGFHSGFLEGDSVLLKPDPESDSGWSNLVGFGTCGYGNGPGFDLNYYAIPRTTSCPPTVVEAEVAVKENSGASKDSSKKRKSDKPQNNKVIGEDNINDKKFKGCEETESTMMIEHNTSKSSSSKNSKKKKKENSADTSKENSKVSDVQKPDYIHVRARRGQATDSHSLAERVRREKISERMKYLQDLVPGCNKITGKAGMLDEIINYVQSLQRQVEFLSMKLAAVNPRLDFNIENNIFLKEGPTIAMSTEMTNSSLLQFNQAQQQQMISSSGIDRAISEQDMRLQRTISAPIPVQETFLDSSCFTQTPPTWDTDFQNIYHIIFDQGRQYTGPMEASNLKMEI